MRTGIVLLIIALPLIELALLIRAGQSIGFWPLMAIILITGTLGVIVFQRQGLAMMRRLFEMQQGQRLPRENAAAPLFDSGLVYVAATLLVFPGLLGDICGLILLVPPIRSWLAARLARAPSMTTWVWVETTGPGPQRRGQHDRPDKPRSDGPNPGTTIDGEFQRLDERPLDQRRKPPSSP